MNRTASVLLFLLLVTFGVNLMGRQKSKSGTGQKLVIPTTYLGRSDYKGGAITKDNFDNLLKQGLTAHDSLGKKFKVVGFQFSYAERKVYEDSVGNLIAVWDYSSEYCHGDTITPTIAASIYERTKAGDTLYFDRVSIVDYMKNSTTAYPDSTSFAARTMKFYIVK